MNKYLDKAGLQDFATKLTEKYKTLFSSPLTASTVAGMTDHTKVYVYTGSQTGYTSGHWYFWNGSAWADGGVYNAVAINTDTTLSISGAAADAKVTGDETNGLKSDLESTNAWLGKPNNEFDGTDFLCPDTSNWGVTATKTSVVVTHKTKWEGTEPYCPLNLEEGTYVFHADFNNSAITYLRLEKDGALLKGLPNNTEFDIVSGSTYRISVPYRNVENEVYTITDISINNTNVAGKIPTLEENTASNTNRVSKLESIIPNDSNLTTTPAMVSFIDDDCRKEVYTDLYPLIQQCDIPYTLAVPIGYIGENDAFMTTEQLQTMVDDGITLSCHTWTEVNMNNVTSDELNAIIKQCEEKYKQYGFDVPTYAYCQGVYTDENIRKAVRKHFKAGFLTKWGINYAPFESFYLRRYGLLSDDSFDLEDAKAIIDYISVYGGWVIFMTHAWFEYFQDNASSVLPPLVNYIKNKGVDIVDINKVINDYGNELECGTFKKNSIGSNNFLVVDYEGKTWAENVKIYNPDIQADTNNVISSDGIVTCALLINKALDSSGKELDLIHHNYQFFISKPIDVTNCTSVLISGWAYYGRAIYAFYDANGDVVGKQNSNNTAYGTVLSKLEVSVPTGAETLVIAGHDNYKIPYAKLITA